jgi:two-component system, chemotaxis family, sensor kinase CheA
VARRDGELKERLLATFQVEAAEHLEALATALLALDGPLPPGRQADLLEETFREMHTLKGAARSVGLLDVERTCHAAETLLSALTRRSVPLSPRLVAALEQAVDGVGAHLAGRPEARLDELARRLERAAAGDDPDPAPYPEQPPEPPRAPEPRPVAEPTVRLAESKLDALLVRGEELLSLKQAADDWVDDAEGLVVALGDRRRALPAGGAEDADLRAIEGRANAMLDRLLRDRRTIGARVDGLLEETRRVRLLPAAAVLDRVPRLVRDLARDLGKEVEWAIAGEALEVDRRVLESITDPLIHIVRNAVDHGIEPPDARVAAGKPRRGRVSATVTAVEGGRIELVVADDGRGIDIAGVREAAVRNRIVAPGAAGGLSDEDVLRLVYSSGLSTAFMVTEVSGHGLGLAIVSERVEQLGGEVTIDSRPGTGTAVRMLLPASIATFRGVLVRAGGQRFMVSIDAVERVVRTRDHEPATTGGRDTIQWQGEALPVARLTALLGLGAGDGETCLVLAAGGERAGVLVDEVLGDREVLVKELAAPLVRVPNVAAAGLLGLGDLVLILRPADLVGSVRMHTAVARAPEPPAPSPVSPAVLVVDDALTTRTMERSLLETAGYRVQVAADGEEAWTALASGEFGLVVSDVDMPRMDGFELTARIRQEPRLAGLPVVLVTALESREDKQRGLDVGANAYVVKSSFEQSKLLEILHRLGVMPGDRSAA